MPIGRGALARHEAPGRLGQGLRRRAGQGAGGAGADRARHHDAAAEQGPAIEQAVAGRFEFTFTPKHGSWLNLIEGFFSKFARSVLRHIRVTSKHELKERIMAGIKDVNRHPVIHTWSYKLSKAA